MCRGVVTNSTDAGFTPFWYMMGVVGVIKHEEGDGWFNWGVGMEVEDGMEVWVQSTLMLNPF